jgi:hypothetical protein
MSTLMLSLSHGMAEHGEEFVSKGVIEDIWFVIQEYFRIVRQESIEGRFVGVL